MRETLNNLLVFHNNLAVKGITMTPEEFQRFFAQQGIELSAQQMQQFAQYYEFLVAENEKMNLTAITQEQEVYLKHFCDSLLPALFVADLRTKPLRLCDVGAGAGFPSLPLKIAFPQLEVTIIDSLNKRIGFLERLAVKLGLENVHFIHARAEEFGGKKSPARQSFDVVTARAVAQMSVLAELCVPLVKLDGQFIALKAVKTSEELSQAKRALALLGAKLTADYETTLPQVNDERHILVFSKTKQTPAKYPRKAGTPAKQPLGE